MLSALSNTQNDFILAYTCRPSLVHTNLSFIILLNKFVRQNNTKTLALVEVATTNELMKLGIKKNMLP